MFQGPRWLYALLGGLMLLLLWGLFSQTRTVDLIKHNDILNQLRDLDKANNTLMTTVLHAKTGLTRNYDSVVGVDTEIQTLQNKLRLSLEHYWADNQEVRRDILHELDALKELSEQTSDQVEKFKTTNSVLLHSSQFLHTAIAELSDQVKATAKPPVQQAEFERLIFSVYSRVMGYLHNVDEQRNQQIRSLLQDLSTQAPALGPVVQEYTQSVVMHVNAILRTQDSSVELLNSLSQLPTTQVINRLIRTHNRAHNDRLNEQQLLQKALVVFSGSLLLLLAFMGYKLMRHYKEIQLTNEKLEDAYAELKESQIHQVQSEKMSALGQMVAGIAHEINTPLAYLKATFNVIQEQLPPIERVIDDSHSLAVSLRSKTGLDELRPQIELVDQGSREVIRGGMFSEIGTLTQDGIHGIDQIAEIVQNLKNFSRLDREKVTGFSVEAGLDSTLLLARNIIKYTVTVVKDYGHVPSVVGAPSQINQVFLNLITNAAHAMPQRPAEDNIIQLRTRWLPDDNMVQIDLEDNGQGIAPEHLPKIFDPFFTTKPIGQGTGMGLSISYKIIREHGGRLEVKSKVGVGTTFSILLPIEGHNLVDTEDEATPLPTSPSNALVD